jgi:hypothetical protein
VKRRGKKIVQTSTYSSSGLDETEREDGGRVEAEKRTRRALVACLGLNEIEMEVGVKSRSKRSPELQALVWGR